MSLGTLFIKFIIIIYKSYNKTYPPVFYGESKPEDRRLTIHDVHCFVYYLNPELYTGLN